MSLGPIDASLGIQAGHTSATTQNLQGATINSGINFAPMIGNTASQGTAPTSSLFVRIAWGVGGFLLLAFLWRRFS